MSAGCYQVCLIGPRFKNVRRLINQSSQLLPPIDKAIRNNTKADLQSQNFLINLTLSNVTSIRTQRRFIARCEERDKKISK